MIGCLFVVRGIYMNCEYSVLVVGTGVVLFPVAEAPSLYNDLINSVLLAQLAADKKIEKTPDTVWYNDYMGFLDKYWLRHSRVRQEWSIAPDNVESVGDWFIAAISKDPVKQRTAAAATLQQLTRLTGSEPALELLRRQMQRVSAYGSRDVRLLVVVAHTPTSVSSLYMELRTDRAIDCNPLAQRYHSEDVAGTVCMRYADANLSETLYSPVRDAIALKVRGRLNDSVATLTLQDGGLATAR
jgi:hypothetical protein